MTDIISLGLWIKRRRKALDMTQGELARRIGCSLDTIRKIEGDARRPSRELAALLANHLRLADDERGAFIQAARAELGTDRLAPPTQSVARGAFVAVPAVPAATNASETAPAPRPSNVPAPPTALLGREQDVAAIAALLRRADVRLVTLTGPGGIGKTHLGLQIAANLVEAFADSVYFVDLAPIREPSSVIGTIAATLGVRESGGQSMLAALKGYVRDKRMLLLLDNFEQVLTAAPLVAELLAAAAQLKLLVTSREVLHLRGEKELTLAPLALPDLTQMPPLHQLAHYSAVALFIERACDARLDFEVTAANAPALAEICVRLDGLPLAIELAAARVKLFTPEALLARLSGRLALLTGGSRDLPTRQQTIRNTIAWSYDLLNNAEQRLFARLGVFVGGWTLEAAESVCGSLEMEVRDREAGAANSTPIPYLPSPVLDGVSALLDKSLVRQIAGPEGEPRFTMLETIREYALEQLEASGKAERLRQQHAIYYGTLAAAVYDQAVDAGTGLAFHAAKRRLQPEFENMQLALAWSQTTAGDTAVALQLALALRLAWSLRGVRREAIAALESSLNHPYGVGRTLAHYHARRDLAELLVLTGNYAAARMQYEQALPISRELGDTKRYATTLERVGWLAREQGNSATAWARISESLAIFRELSDTMDIAWTLTSMAGVAILEEDGARAEAFLAESQALMQHEDEDPFHIAWQLNNLAYAVQLRGAYDRAAQLHHESLQHFPSQYHLGQGAAYLGLGASALGLGNLDEAARYLAQALTISKMLDDQATIAWCLAGLGTAAALDEEPERAARLWAAAERLRQSIGCRPAPAARATYERALALARTELSAEGWTRAWGAGEALTLEEAIAYALEASA